VLYTFFRLDYISNGRLKRNGSVNVSAEVEDEKNVPQLDEMWAWGLSMLWTTVSLLDGQSTAYSSTSKSHLKTNLLRVHSDWSNKGSLSPTQKVTFRALRSVKRKSAQAVSHSLCLTKNCNDHLASTISVSVYFPRWSVDQTPQIRQHASAPVPNLAS